jgi:ATP-binding cassette subfamily B protein RaxB
MIIHLATAAGPLQVGVTSRRQATAPARDAGLTGFAAESAKSAEAAQGDDDCSDDGREGDYSKHAKKDDCSRDGKGNYSKHDGGWKDAKNDDCQPRKDYCQPQKDYCDTKPSDDCGKGDSYRNPGEALAKIDFSRW